MTPVEKSARLLWDTVLVRNIRMLRAAVNRLPKSVIRNEDMEVVRTLSILEDEWARRQNLPPVHISEGSDAQRRSTADARRDEHASHDTA